MSYIGFHLEDGKEIRVSGRERGRWAQTIGGIAKTAYAIYTSAHPLFGHASEVYVREAPQNEPRYAVDRMDTWLTIADSDAEWAFGEDRYPVWNVAVNTALAIGAPMLGLATRLHAQCELHAWIARQDAAYMAGVIRDGLACGFFSRDPMGYEGWEPVVCALDKGRGNLVTSYSVSGCWPSQELAGVGDGAWDRLSRPKQRRLAEKALWRREDLRITPQGLTYTGFWAYPRRVTAYDIARMANELGASGSD